VVSGLGGTARSEPVDRLEVSGFVGLGVFTSDTQLGNSWAPEQVPNTAPVVGGRLGWLALPELMTFGDLDLGLVVEAELSVATAFTGGASFEGDRGRMSYFAPVFGWRAHGLLRLGGLRAIEPHLAIGVGGETVESTSPFMAKETDPVIYWGPGASIEITDRWSVRFDLRHGIMPGRDGATSTFEAQLGVAASLGAGRDRVRISEPTEPPPPVPPPDVDTDHDGIVDRLDKCPAEAETVNGIADDDGCPERDTDGDGIVDDRDKCPEAAEDVDQFEDDDGCPDLDNDGDGIPDAGDRCPLEPETLNGIDDTDGCPDQLPDDLAKALAVGPTLKFEANRARVTAAAKQALKPVRTTLAAHRPFRITITAHPGKGVDADLAKRRAEAVKWYLVDQGIQMARIWTALGDPVPDGGEFVIELAPRPQ